MAKNARLEHTFHNGWLIEDVVALAMIVALCSVLIGIAV